MKRVELSLIIVGLMALSLLTCGCQEQQKTTQVWGTGELPVDYAELFGNSNGARLDYKQSLLINRDTELLYGKNVIDPNGKLVHKRGLIERVMTLEGQIKTLEAETKYTRNGYIIPEPMP